MNGLISDRLLARHEINICHPDTIITQRQYYDYQLDTLEDYCKSGAFLIYELDDILTHVPKWSPHYKDFPKDIKQRLRKAFGNVNRLVVSTSRLKEALTPIAGNTPIKVLNNYLPPIWRNLERYKPENNKKFRLGWAGALAHEMDLEILKPVMEYFKDRVQWVFMGLAPTNMPTGCDVELVNGVALADYPAAVQKLNLNLAVIPLELNMLNRCKSGIRVMELGIFGCPVVATDLEPYRPFKSITRVHNFTADWVQAIESYLSSPEKAHEAGMAVREEIISNHMLMDHLDKVMDAWNIQEKTPAFIPKGIQSFPQEVVEQPFTVIVSCHSAPEHTRNCIQSLLESKAVNKTEFKIVVLTSNSHPEVLKEVELFKDKVDEVTDKMGINDVITQYIGHIIWTRGNTVVYGDWLDRMKKVMDSNLKAATISPFMNEDTISHATLNQENSPACLFPDRDGWATDFICSQTKIETGVPASLPGRNFILFRREALQNCGYFDEGSYLWGYRMTDDWGIVATFHNWEHLIAPSVFVNVHGEPGYPKLPELQKDASHRLILRYPIFFNKYRGVDSPVLSGHKANIEILCAKTDKSSVFVIAASPTLESDLYIQKLGKNLAESNLDLFVVRPASPTTLSIEKKTGPFSFVGKPSILQPIGLATFLYIAKTLNCIDMDIHSVHEYHDTMINFLLKAAHTLKIPVDVTLQDMQWWCPQIHMLWKVNDQEKIDTFCNSSTIKTCQDCVENGTPFGFQNLSNWWERYNKLLTTCRNIYLPSGTSERYAKRYIGNFSNKFNRIGLDERMNFVPSKGNRLLILRSPTSLREIDCYQKVFSSLPQITFLYAGMGQPFGSVPNLKYYQKVPMKLQDLDSFLLSEKPTHYLDLSKYPKMFDELGMAALSHNLIPLVVSEGPLQEIMDTQKEIIGEYIVESTPPVMLAGHINEIVRDSLVEPTPIELPECVRMGRYYGPLETEK